MADYKCPNCQIDLQTASQFCRRCGFKLSAPLVNSSVTEQTTRNLPNLPVQPDIRQTNNFGTSQFGQGQMPGNFAPPVSAQMPYAPVMQPRRRSGGGKVIIAFFIAFGLITLGMILVLIGPLRHGINRSASHTVRQTVTIPGSAYIKSFKLPADGQMSLSNISGKIEVTPYDGDTIEFKATKEDGSNVSDDALDITQSDKSFSVKPRNGRAFSSIAYEIKMPRKLGDLSLTSISGNILVQGIEGRIKANSTSGDVTLEDITGSVDLNTVSGEQTVNFRNPPTGDLKFNSVSGDISLKFPVEPDIRVSFSSITGDVDSEFPLEKKSRIASNTASGTLGKGLFNLVAKTVSGDFKISR